MTLLTEKGKESGIGAITVGNPLGEGFTEYRQNNLHGGNKHHGKGGKYNNN